MRQIVSLTFPAVFVVGCLLVAGCSMFGPGEADTARADRLLESMAGYPEWRTIPGYGDWEQGPMGHGDLVRYYVNGVALDNMAQLPAGSIIVSEDYSCDRVLQQVTVMQRIAGYDPANGDWFWARYAPTGELTHAGSVSMCIGCHQDAGGEDYAFANAGFMDSE